MRCCSARAQGGAGQGSGSPSSAWVRVQSAWTPYMLHIWGASEAWQAQHTSNNGAAHQDNSTGLSQAPLDHPCYPKGAPPEQEPGCSGVCKGTRLQEFPSLTSPLARGSKLTPWALLSCLSSGVLQPPVGEQQLPLVQTHHPRPMHPAWVSPRPTNPARGVGF